MRTQKTQTLDYHENTGGPNGPEYSKQWYKGSFNLIIFNNRSRFH